MRSAVDLADLARMFAAMSDGDHARAAALLGLRARPPRDDAAAQDAGDEGGGGAGGVAPGATGAPHVDRADEGMTLWRVEAATRAKGAEGARKPAQEWEREEEDVPTERLGAEDRHDPARSIYARPATPPLSPWSRLWPRLHRALQATRDGRDPDVGALVRLWGRGEVPRRIPRVQRTTWARRVTVWIDRSEGLVPLWDDQREVLGRLRAVCGREGVTVHRLDDPQHTLTANHGDLPARLRPEAGVPVLALGDLGAFGTDRDRAAWAAAARHLEARGVRRLSLVACGRAGLEGDLARRWGAMAWERSRVDDRVTARAARAEALLRLMASAPIAQPGMLRALRRLLPATEADVTTEMDVWRHPDVRAADSGGVVLRPEAAMRWRERSATDAGVGEELRAAACAVIDAWYAEAPLELVHAETIARLAWVKREGAAASPEAHAAAVRFVKRLEGTLVAGGARWDEQRYGRELLAALPDAVYEEVPALVRVWRESYRRVPAARVPSTIDLDALREGERVKGALRHVAVRQVGEVLVVTAAEGATWPSGAGGAGSPAATLAGVGEHLWLRYGEERAWTQVRMSERAEVTLREGVAVTLAGASDEVTLQPWRREGWASAAGRDAYGLWAEFTVGKVVQRMRWVPPGTFVMGSPEGEVGRWEDEVPHEVTLTEGWWMAETPVTQALWKAVMKQNPSHFKGDDRPVETVSWDECQRFLERLNVAVPGLDARLPTEARWERSYRAGTVGATWLGDLSDDTTDPTLDAIAWYHANSGGETHPVGQKTANPYGLQDVPGNVWEWCSDRQARYAATPVTDPTGAATGTGRVVRGGSSFDDARSVRAAYRVAVGPGYRGVGLGFRLSRGQGSALRHEQAGSEPRSGE